MKISRFITATAIVATAIASFAVAPAHADASGAPGDVGSPAVMLFAQPDKTGAAIMPERIVRESNSYRSSKQRVCATYELVERLFESDPGDIGGPPHELVVISNSATRCVWISAPANRAIVPGAVFAGLTGEQGAVRVRYTWRLGDGRLIGTRVDDATTYRCYTAHCSLSSFAGAFSFWT